MNGMQTEHKNIPPACFCEERDGGVCGHFGNGYRKSMVD